MSSFEPDDTTPLINPQDSSTNHGTFEGNQDDDEPLGTSQNVASDDEILDGNQRTGFQRFNPFDRVPNLPPQLVEELGAGVVIEEPESRWGRFKRFVDCHSCEIIAKDFISFIDSLALINKLQMMSKMHRYWKKEPRKMSTSLFVPTRAARLIPLPAITSSTPT